jgi:hypothetical protein
MKINFFCGSLLCSLAWMAQAAQCPERYPAENAQPAPAGGAGRGSLALSGASMAKGPLELGGDLRGQDSKTKDGHETRYGFDLVQVPPEKWIYCEYGAGGGVRLVRRLADDTVQCVVTHRRRKDPDGPEVTIKCQ